MDNYLKQFREMISLRGLTDHTVKSYSTYIRIYLDFLSSVLGKLPEDASRVIMDCKSGKLGVNLSQYPDCGHLESHNNSYRNRNCPSSQAVQKEGWVDKRRAEVIDAPYFHVVFTLPHELNPPDLL